MKLVELIRFFKDIQTAEELASKELPNVDLGQIDIYLLGELNVESEVKFFDAEEIPNTSIITMDGEKLVNLFPFLMTQEMIEAFSEQKLTDIEIAERLLDYRIKDA